MRTTILFLLVFMSFTSFGLDMKKDYKVIHSYTEQAFKAKDNVKHSIKLFDPLAKEPWTYSAVNLIELLDLHYNSEWKTAKQIIFSALDGYRKKMTVKKLLEFIENDKVYISFESKTNKLPIIYKQKKEVKFTPYYVIWGGTIKENYKKRLKKYGWIYQLKSIDVITK